MPSTLANAYSILTYAFGRTVQFVFSGMDLGGFSFGELLITASIAWYAIERVTKSAITRTVNNSYVVEKAKENAS